MKVLQTEQEPGIHFSVYWALVYAVGPEPEANRLNAHILDLMHRTDCITDQDVQDFLAMYTEDTFEWVDVMDGECGVCKGVSSHHQYCIRAPYEQTVAERTALTMPGVPW